MYPSLIDLNFLINRISFFFKYKKKGEINNNKLHNLKKKHDLLSLK